MKDIKEINDENKIDLISLSQFLLKKGDSELDFLLQVKEYKKIDTSSDRIHDYFLENSIRNAPNELWNNYSFCYKVISNYGGYLKFVPENLRDYSLCEKAVSNSGSDLKFVPENLRDSSICEKAVSNSGSALEHVPENLKNSSLCEKAVSKNGWSLKSVPEELIDYSLCEKAVSNRGEALLFVPIELIDYSLCVKAVSNSVEALESVPNKLMDYNLLKLAYKTIRYLTKDIIRNNLYRYKQYIPQLVNDFPDDKEYFKTYLLQEYISKQVKKLLKENIINTNGQFEDDKEFLLKNLDHLYHLTPDDVPYFEELIKSCIDVDPESIKKIRKYVTSELYNYFLKKYPRLLNSKYIIITDDINLDKNLVKRILRKYTHLLKDLPPQLMTYDIISAAILSYPYSLDDIPINQRTYKLCKLAVTKNPRTFYLVPLPKKWISKVYPNLLQTFGSETGSDIITDKQYYELLKITYLKDKYAVYYSAAPSKFIKKVENELNNNSTI